MKTAIITGASAGIGREFVRQIADVFPEVECYWLIARRLDKLEEMAATLEGKAVRCLPLDLCDPMSFVAYQEKLCAEEPEVVLLVNNAGCGYLGSLGEMETATQTRMVDLNIRALTAMTNMVIPYMPRGGRILNVSSIASFCVNPRMTVYSSTKAYVSSFTLGIDEELRPKGISATAVCSGPMKTDFLDIGGITGNSKMFATLPYCDQVKVAGGALRAARDRRTFYTPKAFYKFYRLLAKVTPSKLMVKIAKT
jgi:short-subunit dehydrogenase